MATSRAHKMITLRNIVAVTAAGMIIALYASTLTSISLLPEYTTLVWASCIFLAALSLATLQPFTPTNLLIGALLSVGGLWLIAWSNGALFLAYLMTKFVIADLSIIPSSAFTPRDVTFRYGLFFAAILLASLPLIVSIAMVLRSLAFSVAEQCLSRRDISSPTINFPAAGIMVSILAGMIALVVFVTLGLNHLQLEHLRISE